MYRTDKDIEADEGDFRKESWLRARNSGRLKWRGKALKDMTDIELAKAYSEWCNEDKMTDFFMERKDCYWK